MSIIAIVIGFFFWLLLKQIRKDVKELGIEKK